MPDKCQPILSSRFQFAKAVKERRLELGITQEELAWRAGLHRTYITDIERGARNLSLTSIAKLAGALQASIAELFSGSGGDAPKVARRQAKGNPDDEELTRLALQRTGIGHRLAVARDGAEALDFLFGEGAHAGRDARQRPAVILLDLKLPKVDGLEVLRRLRADPRTRFTPVVMLSTSREEHDITASCRAGANSYIRKPVDFDQFIVVMQHVGRFWLCINEDPVYPQM